MNNLIEIEMFSCGVMDFSSSEPIYVGGRSETLFQHKGLMTLVELHDLGLYHIKYTKIVGIWYLDLGKSLAVGLHMVKDESDMKGLILATGSDMQIRIYIEGVSGEGGADNQQGTMGLGSDSSERGGPRSPVDNSVGPEFIHLYDESIRTTDDEFEAALHNMGVRRTKRTFAYMQYSSGEEVDQIIVEASEHATSVGHRCNEGFRGGENIGPGLDGLGPDVSRSQDRSASAHNSQPTMQGGRS
ncbi:hypothetical protein LINGRAHAP2_LOCUS34619 [Linum grandiflorum]